jgi:cobalt-zinc-cadmium resistance protein CzcA
MNKAILILFTFCWSPFFVSGQEQVISLEDALEIAITNNSGLRSSQLKVDQSEQLIGSAFNIDKTQAYYSYDQNNIAANGLPLNVWGISQSLQFPSVYFSQKKANTKLMEMQEQKYLLDERYLRKEVSKAFMQIIYWQNVAENYYYLDSLYQQFSKAASRKFDLGESNYLEKITATTKQKEVALLLKQSDENIKKAYLELNRWMQFDEAFSIAENKLPKVEILPIDTIDHPGLTYFEKAINFNQMNQRVEKQKLLPDLHLIYFQGTNNGIDAQVYRGVQAGIGIPLFYAEQKSKIKAAAIENQVLINEEEDYQKLLVTRYFQLQSELTKYDEAIEFYTISGKKLSKELINTSNKAFYNGEIDFIQFILLLENAKGIEMTYLENLYNYNQTALELNYLMN